MITLSNTDFIDNWYKFTDSKIAEKSDLYDQYTDIDIMTTEDFFDIYKEDIYNILRNMDVHVDSDDEYVVKQGYDTYSGDDVMEILKDNFFDDEDYDLMVKEFSEFLEFEK